MSEQKTNYEIRPQTHNQATHEILVNPSEDATGNTEWKNNAQVTMNYEKLFETMSHAELKTWALEKIAKNEAIIDVDAQLMLDTNEKLERATAENARLSGLLIETHETLEKAKTQISALQRRVTTLEMFINGVKMMFIGATE